MSIIMNRTSSIQGATRLPRMCGQPLGDVRVVPPCSCTAVYSGCTKIPLIAEYLTASGELL